MTDRLTDNRVIEVKLKQRKTARQKDGESTERQIKREDVDKSNNASFKVKESVFTSDINVAEAVQKIILRLK